MGVGLFVSFCVRALFRFVSCFCVVLDVCVCVSVCCLGVLLWLLMFVLGVGDVLFIFVLRLGCLRLCVCLLIGGVFCLFIVVCWCWWCFVSCLFCFGCVRLSVCLLRGGVVLFCLYVLVYV